MTSVLASLSHSTQHSYTPFYWKIHREQVLFETISFKISFTRRNRKKPILGGLNQPRRETFWRGKQNLILTPFYSMINHVSILSYQCLLMSMRLSSMTNVVVECTGLLYILRVCVFLSFAASKYQYF